MCSHTLHTCCWGCCRNGTGQKMWRSQPTASWIFTLASSWVRHTHTTILLSLHTLYGLCSHTCAAVTGHVITWNTLCTVRHSTTWSVWGEAAEILTVHRWLNNAYMLQFSITSNYSCFKAIVNTYQCLAHDNKQSKADKAWHCVPLFFCYTGSENELHQRFCLEQIHSSIASYQLFCWHYYGIVLDTILSQMSPCTY